MMIKEKLRQFLLGPSSQKQIKRISGQLQTAFLEGRNRTFLILPNHLRNETKTWLESHNINYFLIDTNRDMIYPVENNKKGFVWGFVWKLNKQQVTSPILLEEKKRLKF